MHGDILIILFVIDVTTGSSGEYKESKYQSCHYHGNSILKYFPSALIHQGYKLKKGEDLRPLKAIPILA